MLLSKKGNLRLSGLSFYNMYILEELKSKISVALDLSEAIFYYPPNSALGDLSLACFEVAKKTGKKPAEISAEWAEKLEKNVELKKYFLEIKMSGPYLNFFISHEYLAKKLIREVCRFSGRYGFNDSGRQRKVMVEYSNGNTHKEYHVGHLRNIAYGDAVNKLLSANGYISIPVSYINDFGIHVAKTIWNWQRKASYAERPEKKGYLLGKCYAEASRELAANPEHKEEVGKIMSEIEGRCGKNYELWRKSRQWSIDYFNSIYKELNVRFQEIFYESELILAGLDLVQEFTEKNILERSEGALIANLEKYDLGVLPIIRSDGTALYPVADLALASEKFKRYKLDESIYVVDVRQSLHFKQLFKVLELVGYNQPFRHLTYDFVTLPDGMMASRTGKVITYQELRDKLIEKLISETTRRRPEWSTVKIKHVAENLAVSTMKFEMLKVGAEKIITFNIEEALRFDGYTACYLQYGYARLRSIIRKGGFRCFSFVADFGLLSERKERELLVKIAQYPEIISAAMTKYNPSELAKYLFELVQLFNDYYHDVNILKAAKKTRCARIKLIKAVSIVLKNGFSILGIEALERM